MYFARFRSTRPLDHLPRALDTLRRMGFVPRRIVLDAEQADRSRIEVIYQPAGHLDPATFVERLKVMPGVEDIADGPVDTMCDLDDADTALPDMLRSLDRLEVPLPT